MKKKIARGYIRTAIYDQSLPKYVYKEWFEKELIKYCKEKNYKYGGSYADIGASGNTLKRSEFQKMLKDLNNKNFDVLVTRSSDRLSRNTSDYLKILSLLKKQNVLLDSITEGIMGSKMEKLYFGFLAKALTHNKEVKSQWTK